MNNLSVSRVSGRQFKKTWKAFRIDVPAALPQKRRARFVGGKPAAKRLKGNYKETDDPPTFDENGEREEACPESLYTTLAKRTNTVDPNKTREMLFELDHKPGAHRTEILKCFVENTVLGTSEESQLKTWVAEDFEELGTQPYKLQSTPGLWKR